MGPLLKSIELTCKARTLFIADPDDQPELRELEKCGADFITFAGNYAAKIAEGIKETDEPLIFTGADDLLPHQGWFQRARVRMQMDSKVQVVGINDLVPRRREHQTHFLMTREYAERPTVDGKPGPFFQGYVSWFCDDELIATAKKRGVYAYAPDAIVEHLHPMAGKAPNDETYRIGWDNQRVDRHLFRQREPLWT